MRGSILFLVVASLVASASISNAAPAESRRPLEHTTSMPNIRSGELFTTALLPSIDNVQRTDSTNGNSGFQFPPPPELPPRRNSPPPMQEQQQQPPSPQQVQQQMQQQVQQYNPSIASTGSSGSNSNRNGFMDTMKEKFPRNTYIGDRGRQYLPAVKRAGETTSHYLYHNGVTGPVLRGAKSTTKSISPSLYKTIGKGRDWAKLQVFGTPSNPSNP